MEIAQEVKVGSEQGSIQGCKVVVRALDMHRSARKQLRRGAQCIGGVRSVGTCRRWCKRRRWCRRWCKRRRSAAGGVLEGAAGPRAMVDTHGCAWK